jgi:beta-galactosidase
VVLVGKDALSARDSTDPRWLALASRGARVLVLEQEHPLHFQALPADLMPTNYVGRIAFLENPEHPLFAGLDQPDFFTWSGDHVVYRNVYKKATRGAVSLAHCDEQLGCSAVAECPVNEGLLILCQMVVGEKLATDPVAQRLFDNMLLYGERYVLVQKNTAVVMDPKCPAAKLLADSGLKFDPAGDLLATLGDGKHQIIVFDATPENLKTLAGAADPVKQFTAAGGWLMAWGLTPEGLADFNRLVGVEHLLRPFELERVTLPALRDPILSGLTVRDVTLESAEQMFPWAGDKYLVDDEFSSVVDFDDIGPFCDIPGSKPGDHAGARAAGPGWTRNMVNGFTSADGWKLIHYIECDTPRRSFKLPREEEICGLSIILNAHYAKATKLELYYDDDPKPVVLATKPDGTRQDFDLTPRKARSLAIKLAEFDKVAKISGIDNLWIHVKRSQAWHDKVKPLANIGGLVKYPMGKGGLVLNQVLAKPSEAVPVNAQKKQAIVATLLRNLHATFAGGRIFTAANLKFQPLPLEEQCNQYLTKDRGWFGGGQDLAHLPIGNQDFGGVPYVIRDFRTSPLPSCVMLAGPGARGHLPKAVQGLKAGCKADVLFFLHAFNRTGEWRRGRPTDPTPVLFKYVVHYADGQQAEVPVLYGEGADHWMSKEPAGLKSAALAWAAPFPAQKSDEQAVVYQFTWNNPRPDVSIGTIDLEYGEQGSRYGTPALLAITAGTKAE